MQVPTRDGWVFVNPYMTLVAAYERLIGARGDEISPPTLIANAEAGTAAAVAATRPQVEPQVAKRPRHGKRVAQRHKKHHKKYARR